MEVQKRNLLKRSCVLLCALCLCLSFCCAFWGLLVCAEAPSSAPEDVHVSSMSFCSWKCLRGVTASSLGWKRRALNKGMAFPTDSRCLFGNSLIRPWMIKRLKRGGRFTYKKRLYFWDQLNYSGFMLYPFFFPRLYRAFARIKSPSSRLSLHRGWI